MEEIRNILDNDAFTAGDPMSQRRWTHQTAEKVSYCLAGSIGITVSPSVVRRLLRELDYSLKSNKKCLSSGNSPYRDKQFGIIKNLREEFMASGDPIISVDTKKKELIGLFKNPGRTWRSSPKMVKDHDFRSEAFGLATPYGIYDLQMNFGVLVVGESADTPEFAVNSILTWWKKHGQYDYPHAHRLLILADSGGSNSARSRVWKKQLQENFADQFGMTIIIAHYPTGASKWNPIEHRMFNEITKNWSGQPLETFDMVVNFARKTVTKTGLHVEAYRDERIYEKGKKVSDKEMGKLLLAKNSELGTWNYTIEPRGSLGASCKSFSERKSSSPYSSDGTLNGKRSGGRQTKDTPNHQGLQDQAADRNSHCDKQKQIRATKNGQSKLLFDLSKIITRIGKIYSAIAC